MSIVNQFLSVVFDVLLYPFRGFHPLVGLTLVSLVFGVVMLLAFKYTSDQDKLAEVKRRIHASLFEIRLWSDDAVAIFRGQWDILRHNATYLRLSLIPLLWVIVPFVLIIAQLQFHYGYRGLEPGESAIFKVELTQDWRDRLDVPEGRPPVELTAPAGLEIEAGPVWVPSLNELSWRVKAEDWGHYQLDVAVAGEEVTKEVDVSDLVARRSPVRVAGAFFDQVLYPAERPLPDDVPLASLTLDYPPANAGIEGWENELTWMLVFFVLSVVFAFALRKPLGVTI